MKEILGDYKKINLDVLKKEEIESIPELEAVVKNSFIKFIKTFDFTKLFEAVSSTFGIASTLPLMGIPHQSRLVEIVDIDLKKYTNLINELYVLRLITNFQTLFWCEHCLDTPQIFVTISRIDPIHLQMKCLKCRKQMLVSKPSELLTYYREHSAELERKLPYRKGINLISCLAWTNWSEIMNTLKEKLEKLSLIERRFVDDLLRYLEIKTS